MCGHSRGRSLAAGQAWPRTSGDRGRETSGRGSMERRAVRRSLAAGTVRRRCTREDRGERLQSGNFRRDRGGGTRPAIHEEPVHETRMRARFGPGARRRPRRLHALRLRTFPCHRGFSIGGPHMHRGSAGPAANQVPAGSLVQRFPAGAAGASPWRVVSPGKQVVPPAHSRGFPHCPSVRYRAHGGAATTAGAAGADGRQTRAAVLRIMASAMKKARFPGPFRSARAAIRST